MVLNESAVNELAVNEPLASSGTTVALLGARVRVLERLKGATASPATALTGARLRVLERTRGATAAPATALTGARLRELERQRGATLASTTALTGRLRELERQRGATLASTVALLGRLRELERLRGARPTVLVPFPGGRLRWLVRLSATPFVEVPAVVVVRRSKYLDEIEVTRQLLTDLGQFELERQAARELLRDT